MLELTTGNCEPLRWKSSGSRVNWRAFGNDVVRRGMTWRSVRGRQPDDVGELIEDRTELLRGSGSAETWANRLRQGAYAVHGQSCVIVDVLAALHIDQKAEMPQQVRADDSV